jgi:hypothetical protein
MQLDRLLDYLVQLVHLYDPNIMDREGGKRSPRLFKETI